MKTLRTLIRLDAVLLALFGYVTASYTHTQTLKIPGVPLHRFEQEQAPLIFLGTAVAVLAMVLYMVSGFALIGHRRKLGTLLAVGNLVIAVVVVATQPSDWGRFMGWIPALVLLIMAMALAWASRRPPGPDDAAADLAALQIPDDIREALLRQIGEAAAQEERNRLARDLHDSIKQQLFTINVSTAAAQELWERDPERARGALADVRRSAREAMVEMQALLHQLGPQALASVGLVEAVREQCEALGYRTGAEVKLELGEPIPDDRLPPGAQEMLFRIVQEALSNVARHARARSVRVWLGLQEETAALRVQDDGQGFSPGTETSGMGLRNLRERTDSLRGILEVDSAPGAGTTVTVRIPLAPAPVSAEDRIRKTLKGERIDFIVLLVPISLFLLLRLPLIGSPADVLVSSAFVLAVFAVAMVMAWWRSRPVLQESPEAPPDLLFRLRYAVHRNRALYFLAASWWAPWYWRLAEEGWSLGRRSWLAVALILTGAAAVELARFHRASETRSGWWTPRRIAGALTSALAALLSLFISWPEPILWLGRLLFNLKMLEITLLLAGVAVLLYTLTRQPRSEGAPA